MYPDDFAKTSQTAGAKAVKASTAQRVLLAGSAQAVRGHEVAAAVSAVTPDPYGLDFA